MSVEADVLDALTAHIAVLDRRGVIVSVNRAWKRFAATNGAPEGESYVGMNYLVECEEAVRRGANATVRETCEGLRAMIDGERDALTIEYPCHSATERRWFVLHATRWPQGGLVMAHEDITVRKLAEEALRETEQTLRLVLETLPVGVWIMDRTGRIVHGNAAGLRIWGGARYVGPEQFGEYKGWWLSTGRRVEAEEWAAARAIRNGETSIDEEIEIECFDGTRKIILNSGVPMRNSAGEIVGALIVNQDITARKHSEDELRRASAEVEAARRKVEEALARERILSRTDSLTGAANRRHFFEMAAHELAVAQRYHNPLSVILLDIDHFKRVNDMLGHDAGDEMLKRIAQIVRDHLREADVFARYGGEEFVILLPHTNAQQATVVAERIREDIATHSAIAREGVVMATISSGVAHLLRDETIDALIRRADEALYLAKRRGRNRTVTLA
jgi:diguanylate cyclase (GGDEF)-like protein/PAS domain S-box-containing protein